ncbi:ATP synthase F1 subunit delta [bacterium]|nr:ATP synthase F1 subunit delta [bacterium]
MSTAKVSQRYAEALYEAAKDTGNVVEVLDAIDSIDEVMEKAPELHRFWVGPQYPIEQKIAVVDEAFAGAPELVRNMLKFLLEKNREDVLFDLSQVLHEIDDTDRNIIRAVLTTAVKLEENEVEPFLKILSNYIGAGTLDLRRKVNPSLISGFTLRFGDTVIDASVARSIEEIRREASA